MPPAQPPPAQDAPLKPLSQTLHEIIDRLPEDRVTAQSILEQVGREGLLALSIILTLPFMVPISIPGLSTVFGAIIVLVSISVILDRPPWLPGRLMRKSFPAAPVKATLRRGSSWIHRIEKVSRPRFFVMSRGVMRSHVNGVALLFAALLLMAPFGLIPLSNTLPGLAILLLALGMLQRDGRCILAGYAAIVVTMIYFAFLLLGGMVLLQKLWQQVQTWLA